MQNTSNINAKHSLKIYGNPYVYIDGDTTIASPNLSHYESLGRKKISESRQLLQNQLAYVDENGGSSSAELRTKAYSTIQKKGSYTEFEIEKIALNIQRQIWVQRENIWGNSVPKNPIEMLDPAVGLKILGYEFEVRETLGQYRKNGSLIEVAGIIDNDQMRVSVSGQPAFNTRNFTAAHELGHAVLHDAHGVHRDKPLDGTSLTREPIEYQADTFAKYFLMPSKLLTKVFESLFLTTNFVLDESTSFALHGNDFVNLERRYKTRRDLSRMLASTDKYNGKQFPSLANQFKVSIGAMAIRLEELNLITEERSS
jgi:Zn-dependent peptidase ImmA (M78 family)